MIVKGDIDLRTGVHFIQYRNKDVSIYGVNELVWRPLDPIEDFGKAAEARIRLPDHVVISTLVSLVKETTLTATLLGLQFHLNLENESNLRKVIEKYGKIPPYQNRKYPRIPSSAVLSTFPLHCIVSPIGFTLERENPSYVFNVDNISPNGILISSENALVSLLRPGQRLMITLEPRGWFPFQVKLQGLICRIFESMNQKQGNHHFKFGIRISDIQPQEKQNFLSLLKDILHQIQRNP